MLARWAEGSDLLLGLIRGGGCLDAVGLLTGRKGALVGGGAGRLDE